jgi:hypothetical protein
VHMIRWKCGPWPFKAFAPSTNAAQWMTRCKQDMYLLLLSSKGIPLWHCTSQIRSVMHTLRSTSSAIMKPAISTLREDSGAWVIRRYANLMNRIHSRWIKQSVLPPFVFSLLHHATIIFITFEQHQRRVLD